MVLGRGLQPRSRKRNSTSSEEEEEEEEAPPTPAAMEGATTTTQVLLDTNGLLLSSSSKRNRRPSVRLGEIGELPVPLLLHKPRRKKRAISSPLAPHNPQPLPVQEEDDGNHIAAEADDDEDPCGVDMSGFSLRDGGEDVWQQRKIKPLEEVAASREESDEVLLLENGGGGGGNVDEPEPEFVAAEEKREEKEGHRKKKRSGKKGKRKSSSVSRSWRSRKLALDVSKKADEEELLALKAAGEDGEDEQHEQHQQQLLLCHQESEKTNSGKACGMDEELQASPQKSLDEIERIVEDDEQQQQEEQEQDQEQDQDEQDHHHHQQQEQERNEDLDESFVLPRSVSEWLLDRRLGKFRELFEYHEVDEEALPLLTMEDLREMGIHTVGSRRKLFHAIQGLSRR